MKPRTGWKTPSMQISLSGSAGSLLLKGYHVVQLIHQKEEHKKKKMLAGNEDQEDLVRVSF